MRVCACVGACMRVDSLLFIQICGLAVSHSRKRQATVLAIGKNYKYKRNYNENLQVDKYIHLKFAVSVPVCLSVSPSQTP